MYKSFINIFEHYVDIRTEEVIHRGFSEDLDAIRLVNGDITSSAYIELKDGSVTEKPAPLMVFMMKYKLPSAMRGFILRYIQTNDIEPELLTTGVYIVDQEELHATGDSDDLRWNFQRYVEDTAYENYRTVTLSFPAGISLEKINKTLSKHEAFLRGNGNKARVIKPYFNAKREQRIIELLIDHTAEQVAGLIWQDYPGYTPTPSEIRKIKTRLKDQ